MKAGRGNAIVVALAAFAAVAALGAAAIRPLDANDLFWHLATGREILRTGAIPRADPFSFTSGGAPWIDHEWLWQLAAQSIHALAGQRPQGPPAPAASAALIAAGALVAIGAFVLGLIEAHRKGAPPGVLAVGGLVVAEAARDRLMVRPETASLLFLALTLTILARRAPGPLRALALAAVASIWANVHPAALIAPVVVLLWSIGDRLVTKGARGAGARSGATGASWLSDGGLRGGIWLAVEPMAVAAATLVNPYGWRLWTVPFELSALIRTSSFYNPEWLPAPISRFPVFYALALVVLAGALTSALVRRRVPDGAVLVALILAAVASRQMRHMGLFAIAALFALAPTLEAFDPRGARTRLLRPAVAAVASAGVLLAAASRIALSGPLWSEGGLDPGRFPVAACEEIARRVPPIRLFNDVRFGGYLIWRFYPERKVFIDGRNEVYASLLSRLGRIHTGESAYDDWRALVGEVRIEGAIVRYNESKKGVLYPPAAPGEAPRRGYRALSAFLFPVAEWALVHFDDTALVFMKRGGRGEGWTRSGEYRVLNPEDEEYVLGRAAHDPGFARELRQEAVRRLALDPPCHRLERLVAGLGGIAPSPAGSL